MILEAGLRKVSSETFRNLTSRDHSRYHGLRPLTLEMVARAFGMWRTPHGTRTLLAPEAILFRAALDELAHWLQAEADDLGQASSHGVQVFDELTWQQRLALLVLVGEALLSAEIDPPPLTAVNEGTIAAAFVTIAREVVVEIDYQSESPSIVEGLDVFRWRRMILACFEDDEDPELPELSRADAEQWDTLIECITSTILWDEDWDNPGLLLDVDPERSRAAHERFGIPEDYYTAIAPDPRDDELPILWQRLRAIVQHG